MKNGPRAQKLLREIEELLEKEPASPAWFAGIRFRRPNDKEQAIKNVAEFVRMITERIELDHKAELDRIYRAHELETADRYAQIVRLECDLRDACLRDAEHMIERAQYGRAVAFVGRGEVSPAVENEEAQRGR